MLVVARRQHQSMRKQADGPRILIARPVNDLEFHLDPSRLNVRRGNSIWSAYEVQSGTTILFLRMETTKESGCSQRIEVAIGCTVLKRMLACARPKPVRLKTKAK